MNVTGCASEDDLTKNCIFFCRIFELLYIKLLSFYPVLRIYGYLKDFLTLPAPFIFESCIKIKALKAFKKPFEAPHKTFSGTTKKCENKNFKLLFSLRLGSGREGLRW